MSTAARARDIVARIKYKRNTDFRVIKKKGMVFIQHLQYIPCTNNGLSNWQGGRKFYISDYATDEEILRTCFLAVKLFEEHEINETFLVDGERFLNPHPEGARPQIKEVS